MPPKKTPPKKSKKQSKGRGVVAQMSSTKKKPVSKKTTNNEQTKLAEYRKSIRKPKLKQLLITDFVEKPEYKEVPYFYYDENGFKTASKVQKEFFDEWHDEIYEEMKDSPYFIPMLQQTRQMKQLKVDGNVKGYNDAYDKALDIYNHYRRWKNPESGFTFRL